MAPTKFKEHLCDIEPAFIKASRSCCPISADERLNVKRRHLLTQDPHTITKMNCIISSTTVERVIKESSNVLYNVLILKGYLDPSHRKLIGKNCT